MSESMVTYDLWLKMTSHDGKTTYTAHRVWDGALFMEARKKDAQKENEKNNSVFARAEQITRDDYLKATKKVKT